MTVHDIGLDLLGLIGVQSFNPSQNSGNVLRRGLGTRDVAFVLQCLNGSMQECFALGPVELREKPDAATLHPPTVVTLNATQYSQTIASLTTYTSWMIGCTIRISGDTRDNEIVSQTALLRPYMGSTNTGLSATVWADAVALASNVGTILSPVEIPQQHPMRLVGNRAEFDARSQYGYNASKPIGVPDTAYCSTTYLSTNPFTQRFLRVTPMPNTSYSLSYTAKLKPPTYVQADFYASTTYDTDPNTVIPFDFVESTLLPIARQRMMAHPAFDNPALAQELGRAAEFAKRIFVQESRPLIAEQEAIYV